MVVSLDHWKSDKYLVIPKMLYFNLAALCYSTYIFSASYFKEVWHIESDQYGYILGYSSLSAAGSVFWTYLADRTLRHRTIMVVATLGYMISFCAFRTNVLADHPSDNVRFIFVTIVFTISSFFTTALYPLLDNRIFKILEFHETATKESFGRQRLFANFGMSFIASVSGIVLDIFKFDGMFFLLCLTAFSFIALVAVGIPPHHTFEIADKFANVNDDQEQEVFVKKSFKIGDDACNKPEKPLAKTSKKSENHSSLLKNPDVWVFLTIVITTGITRAIPGIYMSYYLEYYLKISKTMIGLVTFSRIFSEISVYFFSKQIIEASSIFWLMLFGILFGILRVGSYAVLPIDGEIYKYFPFVIELLKGINSACLTSAFVRFVNDIAPIGMENTTMGIYSSINSYLSYSISGFIGGKILASLHGKGNNSFQLLFGFTSLIGVFGMAIFVAWRMCVGKM